MSTGRERMSKLLLIYKKRTQYVALLIFMAMVVGLGVTAILKQNGVAMTHTEVVLDCHAAPGVAHTHNADCYDDNGNLVCPLPEVELHTHDDSCYTESRELVCGLVESGGHTHTDACYDEDGNLVCGLDESEGHTHTDACYEITRELTCGLPEVTEEHVHGPGCFTTVQVDDGQSADVNDSAASQGDGSATVDELDWASSQNAGEQDPSDDTASAAVEGELADAADLSKEMPAQSFDHIFKDQDQKAILTVHVDAPEGALPAGTTMRATWVNTAAMTEKQQAAVEDAVAAKADGLIVSQQAVDITFLDAEGNDVEPADKVTVTFASPLIDTKDQAVLVHVDDLTDEELEAQEQALAAGLPAEEAEPERSAQPVDELSDKALAQRDMSLSDNEIAFESDAFSTYVLAVTTLQHTMRCNGQTVTITVDAPAEAGVPAGAMLQVRELGEGTGDYQSHLDMVNTVMDAESVQFARFFDISIVSNGQEVHPAVPVHVELSIADAPESEHAEAQVVHFGEGMELVAAQEADGTTTFDAESFSVYGVVYTVDFVYGGYMVSTPGESSVLLSQLAAELALPGADGTGSLDLSQVENVTFSDESLVRVTKVNETTTVGSLLNQLDATGVQTWMAQNVVVHTDGKTDEQILAEAAAIEQVPDETAVAAGDWVLTSLQAFHTSENLVITLTTGEKIVVGVEDLDTATNGVKPGTVQGVDTASEGITITMFDYGPEKLDNVNNTYNSVDNSGINKNHELKFYSYGTEGSTINNFTGGAYAMQGVVRNNLVQGSDGNWYPVVNNGKESLEYLFSPTTAANGKTVVSTNANYLFQRDANGSLYYDSDQNYAYLDGDNFVLYNDTYLEEGADYENPFRIGFYPYNDYDNRYHCIHGNNFNWGCKGSQDRRVRDQVGHYNHHFGMKVEGKFYMTDDKLTPETNQEMVFRFSGDDDMWVFVDGVLVLDIGGIHNPVDGEINFTTGQVTVSAAKTANGGANYALGTNTTIAQAFAKAGKTWDDSPLSQHDIKIFYMERGGMYSNLAVTMNLPTFPGPKEVSLWKVDQENAETGLAGAKFELYSDVACTKPVKPEEGPGPIIVSSANDPLGKITVSNLIPGQTYYLKEIQAPEGYKLDNRVFKIVAPANNDSTQAQIYVMDGDTPVELVSHEITNEKDKYGSLSFTKVDEVTTTAVSGAEFTLYTDADCKTVAKAKDGSDLKATSTTDGTVDFGTETIPAGKTYYMKETHAPDDYFPSSNVYTVEVSADGATTTVSLGGTQVFVNTDSTKQITNKPKAEKTSMSVEKVWSDGSANHTGDTVEVTLYETHKDEHKTGGNISITVEAGNWYKNGSTGSVTAPQSGSITYKLQKKVGDGDWEYVDNNTYTLTYSSTSSESWKHQHTHLPDWDDDKPIVYRAVVTDQTLPVVVADGDKNSTVTGEDNGVATITAGVQVNTKATVIVHVGTYNTNNNQAYIHIEGCNLYYRDSNSEWKMAEQWMDVPNPYSSNTNWKNWNWYDQNATESYTNINKHLDASTQYYVGFHIDYINGYGQLGVNTNPSYTNGYLGSSYYYFVPLTSDTDQIDIYIGNVSRSFNAVPTTRTKSTARGLAQQIALAVNDIVTTGLDVPSEASVVLEHDANITPDGITNPVTLRDGIWGYTWSGLVSSKEITEGGYTFTRTYTYYVKETKVTLANGDSEDTVTATYQTEGDKVTITNTVPPRTSLEVTKKWLTANNEDYTPDDSQKTITFDVYQVVDGTATVYKQNQTITYANGTWSTATIDNLPTKVKVGGELKDATYYVVETSLATSDTMITYYEANGHQYPDASDAAGATSETIVNKNSQREISVTKQWFYKKGNQVVEAKEPPETDVHFKLMKVDKNTGGELGYYNIENGKGIPASSVSPEGYEPYVNSSDGTIYHLTCTSTTTEKPSELDPNQTVSTTTWSWNTLTFTDLPTGCKYYLVETDAQGNTLLNDAVGTQIAYIDENGKLIGRESPIDPSIPGNYTIKNTEHRTSLYAQKVWQGANKDNLAGNENVWFSLMRIETDGNGNYDLSTLQETPGIGRFALKESSGWVKYFDSIEVAPPERHANDTYKYWQYFIVELGLLNPSTADAPDAEKQYKLIDNMWIKYQSKGSGTAADGSVAPNREEFMPYAQGVDGMEPTSSSAYRTVHQWISSHGGQVTSWLQNNSSKVQLNTWAENYDGMGTLGVFNSSEEYVDKPLEIKKVWKNAEGGELSADDMAAINAGSVDDDRYMVEIQLMQHAYNLGNDSSSQVYDVAYGSTFMVDPGKVVMQSDLFEVKHKNDAGNWEFEIPALNSKHENQLPAKGPFRLPNGETVMADFTYYVSEYRVYDADGNDVSTQWTAACQTTQSSDSYGLQIENRKTTDLVLHKKWEDVSAGNRAWVNDNVKTVLFKLWRQAEGEAEPTDITEYIAVSPAAYGLTSANVYDIELNDVFEGFVRVEQPQGGWAITDTGSVDATIQIQHLDALVKGYGPADSLSAWPKYKYWIVEAGYLDAAGEYHPITALLHGNDVAYPKYQSSTTGASALADGGTSGSGSSAGESAKVELSTEGQNHLGAINTVRGFELTIVKTDNAATPKKLTGAEFELKRKDASGSWVAFDFTADADADAATADVTVAATEEGKFTITNENGYIVKNLMPGVYELTELKAPAGYIKLFEPVGFEITAAGTVVQPGTTTPLADGDTLHFKYTAGTSAGKASGELDVVNEPGAELPAAGGAGTMPVQLAGCAIVALGAMVLLQKRRQEA